MRGFVSGIATVLALLGTTTLALAVDFPAFSLAAGRLGVVMILRFLFVSFVFCALVGHDPLVPSHKHGRLAWNMAGLTVPPALA